MSIYEHVTFAVALVVWITKDHWAWLQKIVSNGDNVDVVTVGHLLKFLATFVVAVMPLLIPQAVENNWVTLLCVIAAVVAGHLLSRMLLRGIKMDSKVNDQKRYN